MSVDRFQLLTTTALAIATGALGAMALSSRDAEGFPAGPTLSYGANPVVAKGGTLTTGSSATVFTAPEDQDIIVTDVVLTPGTTDTTCIVGLEAQLELGSGTNVGTYAMLLRVHYTSYPNFTENVVANYVSGLRIPAGDSLEISAIENFNSGCSSSSMRISYSISGHYAQP